MNVQNCDVLKTIYEEPGLTQREISQKSGHSLGIVNRSIKELQESGLLNKDLSLTDTARNVIAGTGPRNAVILAAGFGMRMVPINTSVPKGLLEIHGEPLIERLIRQLNEAGVSDITIVVGFMKESFDYLIDEFGVKLVYNPEYSSKNNLASLALAAEEISNTYIVPSDVWCRNNPFHGTEFYSWYMMSSEEDEESTLGFNRKKELVQASARKKGNAAIGISYINEEDSAVIRKKLKEYSADPAQNDSFWEAVLFGDKDFIPHVVICSPEEAVEINTYEQLRNIDSDSGQLQNDAIDVIREVFGVNADQIRNISVLKKGMTNRSFLFEVNGQKYIMRIPGEGTDKLINRANEAKVYQAISGRNLCDDPVYINPVNGYKITKYLNDIRVADAGSEDDLVRCMNKLRSMHEMHIVVDHSFDIFGQIDFYERLWNGIPSIYRDYAKTKEHVLSLRPYIDSCSKELTLTHIDAVPDNFLFYRENGEEKLQLTDWEYSGMQDPHVDIAMFSIYSYYDKEEVDHLIDIYFEGKCDSRTRAKIYCYVAACGLLWSNWTEYKNTLGVEFGEYGMRQFRYAKDFYKYAIEEMKSGQ